MSAIDYDLKKIKAFAFDVDGVLSPSTIPLSSEGEPLRMVNIKDGYALQLAVKYGYEILGITNIFQGSAKKLPVLTAWMESKGLEPDEVAYMGDDIPDLQAMRHIGLPCAPHDACTEAKQTAIYVSPFGGGYGCGRDLIEQVMKAQGVWMSDARAFGW